MVGTLCPTSTHVLDDPCLRPSYHKNLLGKVSTRYFVEELIELITQNCVIMYVRTVCDNYTVVKAFLATIQYNVTVHCLVDWTS